MTRRRFPVRMAAPALVLAPLLLTIPAAVPARAAPPAAAIGPTAATLGCRLYFNDAGTGSSPTVWQDTFTLTQSPAEPKVGDTVTVTLTAPTGPDNGPVGLNAGDVPVNVTLALGGSLSGSATLRMSSYPARAVAPAEPLGPITATGTYFAAAAGAATLTVGRVTFANASATTHCSAAGDRDHKAAPVPTSIVENFTVGGTGTATPPPSPSASATPSPSAKPSPSLPPSGDGRPADGNRRGRHAGPTVRPEEREAELQDAEQPLGVDRHAHAEHVAQQPRAGRQGDGEPEVLGRPEERTGARRRR